MVTDTFSQSMTNTVLMLPCLFVTQCILSQVSKMIQELLVYLCKIPGDVFVFIMTKLNSLYQISMGILQKGLEKIETVYKSEAVVKYMCRLKVMNLFAFLRSLNQFLLHIPVTFWVSTF